MQNKVLCNGEEIEYEDGYRDWIRLRRRGEI